MGNSTCSRCAKPNNEPSFCEEVDGSGYGGWLFPMYLVKIRDFLEMEGVPEPHHVLKQKGLLHAWQPGMFSIFISHQWLGKEHPDPKGRAGNPVEMYWSSHFHTCSKHSFKRYILFSVHFLLYPSQALDVFQQHDLELVGAGLFLDFCQDRSPEVRSLQADARFRALSDSMPQPLVFSPSVAKGSCFLSWGVWGWWTVCSSFCFCSLIASSRCLWGK